MIDVKKLLESKAAVLITPPELKDRLATNKSRAFQMKECGDLTLYKHGAAMSMKDGLMSEVELKALMEKRGMEFDPAYMGRQVRYWASDQRVDAHGDIVLQNWDFTKFEKNSPMPWSHNWYAPPIGRHLSWDVTNRSDSGYAGPATRTFGVFALPQHSKQADDVQKLVQAGMLPCCSVGFEPMDILDVKDTEERKKLGLGRWGVVYAKSALLEVSPTTIPANPGAVTFSLFKSAAEQQLLTPDNLAVLREIRRQEAMRTSDPEETFSKSEAALFELVKYIFPGYTMRRHTDIEEPVVSDEITQTENKSLLQSIETNLAALKKTLEGCASKDEVSALTKSIDEVRGSVDELGGLVQDVRDSMDVPESDTTNEGEVEEPGEGSPLKLSALQTAFKKLQDIRATFTS